MIEKKLNANADGLLVARICHDLKNCLSVIAFLKEDIAEGIADWKTGVSTLVESVDKLSLRLNFFQNLTVDSAHLGNLYEMLQQMCEGTNVKLIFDICTDNNSENFAEQNIICGILYLIIIDALRSGAEQTIIVSQDVNTENINISILDTKIDDLPQELHDIAKMSEVEANVVNALALYVKEVMQRHGYYANIYDVKTHGTSDEQGVKIVLAKLR